MLTLDQAHEVYRGLSLGYMPVKSRLELTREVSGLQDENVAQHLLGYRVPEGYSQGRIPLYCQVDNTVQDLLSPYLARSQEIIDKYTESYQYSFLILSTAWCGKPRHVKHLHTILQDNPQRTLTFSVAMPLYLVEDAEEHHKFYWNYRDELYPKITYTSHQRTEKFKVNYTSIDMSKSSVSSMAFDSARCLHFIDNTPHMYLWVVCDAVVLVDGSKMLNGVRLHQDSI